MNNHRRAKVTIVLLLGVAWGCLTTGGVAHAQDGQYDVFGPGRTPPPEQDFGVMRSVEFVDTPITTIFRMISDLTGWSIVMSPEVSREPPKMNIWVKNLPPDQVLDQVVEMAGLVSEREGATIRVMTFQEYARMHGAVERVVDIEFGSASEIKTILEPLIEGVAGAKVIVHESGNKLVVLMPKALIDSVVALIETLDVPFEAETVQIIRLEHLDARKLVPILSEFISAQMGQSPEAAARAEALFRESEEATDADAAALVKRLGERWLVQFMVEPSLNLIVLRGRPRDLRKVTELVEQLDVPPGIEILSYDLRHSDAQHVLESLQMMFEPGEEQSARLRMTISEPGNRLVVEGTPPDQEKVAKLIEALDRDPGVEVVSYQLTYTDAPEVFEVLQSMVRADGVGSDHLRLAMSETGNRIIVEGTTLDHRRLAGIIEAVDQALPPGSGGTRVYRLKNTTSVEVAQVLNALVEDRAEQGVLRGREDETPPAPPVVPAPASAEGQDDASVPPAGATVARGQSPKLTPPTVTEAPEINAVVVQASAAEHEEFAAIIAELDEPRYQVLLEVTLVTLRTDEALDLGLEAGGAGRRDGVNVMGLTNFGIGAIDPTTAAIRLASPPPFGANLAIFNADDFSIVLNALQTLGKTRIHSVPKILVEDNSEAQITNLNQEPFEVSSQGETATITSFGGFVDAGTTLLVIPYVTDENWLRLRYDITLSSFGARTSEQSAANLPPPRREMTAAGVVRVPADHIVSLGGFSIEDFRETVDKVPLLGDIPLLGKLFQRYSESDSVERLFIFIRPVVLADPNFSDLLHLSRAAVRQADLTREEYLHNPLKMTLEPLRREETVQP